MLDPALVHKFEGHLQKEFTNKFNYLSCLLFLNVWLKIRLIKKAKIILSRFLKHDRYFSVSIFLTNTFPERTSKPKRYPHYVVTMMSGRGTPKKLSLPVDYLSFFWRHKHRRILLIRVVSPSRTLQDPFGGACAFLKAFEKKILKY